MIAIACEWIHDNLHILDHRRKARTQGANRIAARSGLRALANSENLVSAAGRRNPRGRAFARSDRTRSQDRRGNQFLACVRGGGGFPGTVAWSPGRGAGAAGNGNRPCAHETRTGSGSRARLETRHSRRR